MIIADDTNSQEQQYLDLLEKILQTGAIRGDRTGTGTRSLFGQQLRFDLSKGFPLMTTKRIFFKGAVAEILWFLSGATNIRPLQEQGVHIWDEWADKNGELGPVYGKQWRDWETKDGRRIDQISQVMDMIKNDPTSRRILFTGWNVGEISQMALPPCHMTYQFYVADGKLSGALYQRSADAFLGLPWNLCEAALLIHMFAHQAGLDVGDLIWFGADVHLYLNHTDQAQLQISRRPRSSPRLSLARRPSSLFEYKPEDFVLEGYDPAANIPAPVAV